MSGTDKKPQPRESSLRLMTTSEIELARTVFSDRISYNKVWIHHNSFLPFGLQHERVAMTPLGEIYYRTSLYKEDYAKENLNHQHTFIHELSHVWQRERGMCVICRGIVSGLVSYSYRLDGRLLSEYPMEQQAQIIADNFLLTREGYTIFMQYQRHGHVTLDGNLDESLISQKYKYALRGFPW